MNPIPFSPGVLAGRSRITSGALLGRVLQMVETYEQINAELDILGHRLKATMDQVLGRQRPPGGVDLHDEVARLAAEIKARCAQLEALSSARLKAVRPN